MDKIVKISAAEADLERALSHKKKSLLEKHRRQEERRIGEENRHILARIHTQ